MICNRISSLSQDEKTFNNAIRPYKEALKNSGYNEELQYNSHTNKSRKSRKRKVTWFNPPFSNSVKTKIGKEFFKIVDNNFPPHHRYAKIFNKNTLKLSYSCMPNFKTIIASHNSKLLEKHRNQGKVHQHIKSCSCSNKTKCPLENKCMEKSLVYEATISTSTGPFKYIGISESNFKIRYNNHQNSFRNRKYQNITELSKKVWELKDNNQGFTISWKKLQGTNPFTPGKKKCNLCVTEKLYIIKHKVKFKEKLLNKKSEIISKCRHENKYMLRNIV